MTFAVLSEATTLSARQLLNLLVLLTMGFRRSGVRRALT